MKALPVHRLSTILATVSSEARRRGIARIAIGGGSAPALLDYIFTGSALRMRDFDMVAVADRQVEQELARGIGQALDSPEMRFLPRYVYPRRRSRSQHEELWTAGWGLLWDGQGVEVDLSIFHDDDALRLNGLMNVDRILIPLPCGATLNEIAAAMLTAGSAEAAVNAGLVDDPDGGYAGWHHRAPAIVAWNAIHASPIECAMRIVRTCVNKLHMTHLHPELADPLRAAVLLGHERGDRFVRLRTIVKLFHDERAGVELEILHELGAFLQWLPEIGGVIDHLGRGALSDLFANACREGRTDASHHAAFLLAGEQGGDEMSALRLEALLLQMPPASRDRVLDEVAFTEPGFAALVRGQLPVAAKRHPRSNGRTRRRPARQSAAQA